MPPDLFALYNLALPGLVLSYKSALSGIILGPAYRANSIWCAVLLVLPPLGQADISSFGKNLLQVASAATAAKSCGLILEAPVGMIIFDHFYAANSQ